MVEAIYTTSRPQLYQPEHRLSAADPKGHSITSYILQERYSIAVSLYISISITKVALVLLRLDCFTKYGAAAIE
jgi:hypothetical protein